MVSWRPEFNPDHLYFVTTTAVHRAALFESDVIKRILVDGLYYMRMVDRTSLFAFVIMPNHIHFLVRCRKEKPLGATIRDYKANTARLIIRQFQAYRAKRILAFMRAAVNHPEKQAYKVWGDGYSAKDIFSQPFLRQKINYVHNNPLQPHWRLATRARDYAWSSARFYSDEGPALIPLDDARELLTG